MKGWYKSNRGLASLAGLLLIVLFAVFISSASAPADRDSSEETKPEAKMQAQINEQPQANLQTKKVETKNVNETQAVPFQAIVEDDASLPKNTSQLAVKGVDGVKTLVYKVTYVDGVETSREKVSEAITTQPVNQVTKVGTSNTPPPASPSGPAGATAVCKDGTFSYSKSRLTACVKHGGITIWYR